MAVEERGYQSQVGPARSAALPGADPAAFGADVGRAIGAAGESIHRAKLNAYQIERQIRQNQESSDFSVKFAQLQAETEDFERSLKTGDNPLAQPGAAGHEQLVMQYFQERAERLTDGLTETAVIQQAHERTASYQSNLSSSAGAYEAGAAAAKVQTDAKGYRTVQEARVRRAADPSILWQTIEDTDHYVDGLQHLTPDQREAVRVEMHNNIIFSWAGGAAMEADPAAMRQAMESGRFDALPSQMREHLFNRLDVLENRQQVAIDRAAREAAAAQTNAEDALRKQADDGVAVDVTALLSASRRAEAEGRADRAYDFRMSAVNARVNGIWGEALPDQISARMGAIEQMKDWRSNPDLVAEHGQLDMLRGKARSAEANYATPLDAQTPASFAQREQDAMADMKRRGLSVPKPLGVDDVQRFQDMAKSGLKGLVAVANELAHFSARFAMAAARQVDSGNDLLVVASTLPAEARALILRGGAAGKVNPDAITPAIVDRNYTHSVGIALGRMPEDYQRGVKQAAECIADTLVAESRGGKLTAEIWGKAVHLALGGTYAPNGVRQGGMGMWNGQRLLLPYRMSQEDFDRRLSRFGTLNGAYSSSGPVTADQLRKYYTPVNVGGGYFHFVDRAGRPLKNKQGENAALYITWNGK